MQHLRASHIAAGLGLGLIALGCGNGQDSAEAEQSGDAAVGAERTGEFVASTQGAAQDTLSPESIERGRMDASWRRFVDEDDSGGASGDTATTAQSWSEITPADVNRGATRLPLSGDVAGPDVLQTQILLDRAWFSPGVIDGRWGKNTEKAVYWFQTAHDLPATGTVDDATLRRLRAAAGDPERVVVQRTLTEEDVAGPFVELPEDVYERAEMECLCYESLREQLGERFHATPELLEQLNPDVDLNAVSAGDQLWVPAVRSSGPEPRGQLARIRISDGGHYLHALDASSAVLYHFPSTLGSDYAPSPEGEYSIESIHHDPRWHYKPDLLTGVDDSRPPATLPPGPNNAVGVVWIQLSKPHYGIHGTSAPQTIGYVTSHGCVRLTNWDATTLAERASAGTPVQFVDGDQRGG